MNLLQQNPKQVTTLSLLLQRIILTAVVAALTVAGAALVERPELVGGAAVAQVLYLVITTIKDFINPKIPNVSK